MKTNPQERDLVARLTEAWEYRPTGGTEREVQAWRNGFSEALVAMGLDRDQRGEIMGVDPDEARVWPRDPAVVAPGPGTEI